MRRRMKGDCTVNSSGDKGAAIISEFLKGNSTLTALYLSSIVMYFKEIENE